MATVILKENPDQVIEPLIDPIPGQQRQASSLLSKATYSYFNSVLHKGAKKELVLEDFAAIEDADKAKDLAEKITAEWDKVVIKSID